MVASDGKRYKTDAADTETMFRIIQSIPSPKAEPAKWLSIIEDCSVTQKYSHQSGNILSTFVAET